MEKGYFAAAWGDVTKSPGWISKILRLGLLSLVPIFGPIVVYGYLFGWARDIAWNVHRPLPDKIFGNEDGQLYKRGFFIILIYFVFSLVPAAFDLLASLVSGTAIAGGLLGVTMNHVSYSFVPAVGGVFLSMVLSLVSLVLVFAVCFFDWVGAMRTSLYGTLSAGFQLNKIWAMLRYDFAGLLRIFGMALIMGLVVGLISLLAVLFIVFALSIAMSAAFLTGSSSYVVAMVGVGVSLLFGVAALLLIVFCIALCGALIVRALGYWTRQFEVNRWGGQEDPMPFEQRLAAQQYSAPQQPSGQVGVEQASQQQVVAQVLYQGDASSATAQQAQYGVQGAQDYQPASYDPSGSVPVQTAPYQAAQQPVSQAPFQEHHSAVVHEADSPTIENGESLEASAGASPLTGDSAAVAAGASAQPEGSSDEPSPGEPSKPDVPDQGGSR